MILPLRRVHRAVFVGLALLLPAMLASAWRARHAPSLRALPPELVPGPPPPADSSGADELVYWSSATPRDSDGLPADAALVGTVRSGALTLTPPPGQHVFVYSLAHARLVRAGERE